MPVLSPDVIALIGLVGFIVVGWMLFCREIEKSLGE